MPEVNRSAAAATARGGGGPRKSPLRLAADPVPVVSAGSSRGLMFLRAAGSGALTSPPRSGGR
jgi:hypothetical protein